MSIIISLVSSLFIFTIANGKLTSLTMTFDASERRLSETGSTNIDCYSCSESSPCPNSDKRSGIQCACPGGTHMKADLDDPTCPDFSRFNGVSMAWSCQLKGDNTHCLSCESEPTTTSTPTTTKAPSYTDTNMKCWTCRQSSPCSGGSTSGVLCQCFNNTVTKVDLSDPNCDFRSWNDLIAVQSTRLVNHEYCLSCHYGTN